MPASSNVRETERKGEGESSVLSPVVHVKVSNQIFLRVARSDKSEEAREVELKLITGSPCDFRRDCRSYSSNAFLG